MNTLILASDALILAEGPDWDSGILKVIGGLMKVVAVLVVLFAAVKGTKDAMGGKVGKAASLVVGCLAIVVFLWEPSLINKMIDLMTGVTDQGVTSIEDVVTDNGGTIPSSGGK